MMTEQFEFNYDICERKHGGNDQSLAAWRSKNRDNKRGQTFEYIYSREHAGATADECAEHFRTFHNTIAPRLSELKALGFIVKSGRERMTRSGCMADVFIAREFAE